MLKKLTFFPISLENHNELPFISTGIKAGFPSPAADFEETKISLDAFVVKNKEATFYAKANGNSMIKAGIDDGDLLVIDRSLQPQNKKIAVCFIDGEFTVKRLKIESGKLFLLPENDSFPVIEVTENHNFIVWGIVTFVVKNLFF